MHMQTYAKQIYRVFYFVRKSNVKQLLWKDWLWKWMLINKLNVWKNNCAGFSR